MNAGIKRLVIGQACGAQWQSVDGEYFYLSFKSHPAAHPLFEPPPLFELIHQPNYKQKYEAGASLPDYPNDKSAMFEAFEALSETEQRQFVCELYRILRRYTIKLPDVDLNSAGICLLLLADSTQMANAFLEVLVHSKKLSIPSGQCCINEDRSMDGGCLNCGAPCL